MENILEVENLCKGFSNGDFALDKVSFSIPYGSIMGFVGKMVQERLRRLVVF